MKQAVRAVIIEDNKLLLISRNNEGNQYFTLVGGKVRDGETQQQALRREVREETGMEVTDDQLVFIEEHPEPYAQQYIFLCKVAEHGNVKVQNTSEEALLNIIGINLHEPVWASISSFPSLPFRTPQLKDAIIEALKSGFPQAAIKL